MPKYRYTVEFESDNDVHAVRIKEMLDTYVVVLHDAPIEAWDDEKETWDEVL